MEPLPCWFEDLLRSPNPRPWRAIEHFRHLFRLNPGYLLALHQSSRPVRSSARRHAEDLKSRQEHAALGRFRLTTGTIFTYC